MIVTDRIITVRKGTAKIDEPVIVYRGDYEVILRFSIMNSRFKFMSGTNMIESEKAAYGQLAILTPYGGNIFSNIARCSEGAVSFQLTKELLDQIEEVGLYSFQIRLFDGNREARVSIPPVEFGIEIREPITSEDHDNSVNNAIVGYSIAKIADALNEEVGPTFVGDGYYNKTIWETGDRITEGKLNKIEDALDTINQNEIADVAALDKRITTNYNVLDSTKADKNEIFSMENMGQDIKEAMTGGSVAVVGTNAVNTENIVDKSINASKIWNQYLYSLLFYEGNTVPDFTFNDTNQTLTLTLPPTCYLMVGHAYTLVGENNVGKTITIPYPPSTAGVSALWYSTNTKTFELINYNQHGSLNMATNKEKYLIATIGFKNGKSVTMPGRYTINGKALVSSDSIGTTHIVNNAVTRAKLNRQVQQARIFANGVINCQFMDNGLRMHLPRNSYITLNEWYRDLTPNNEAYITVEYPEGSLDGIIYLLYNIPQYKFYLVRYSEIEAHANNNDILFVGTVGVGTNSLERSVSINADYVVDGGVPGKEFHLTFAKPIIYDRYANKIRIPEFFVQRAGMAYKRINPTYCGIDSDYFEFSLPNAYDIYMLCLDYNKVLSWANTSSDANQNPIMLYKTANMPSAAQLQNNLCVIATMIYDNLTTIYPYDEVGGPRDLEWASFNSRKYLEFDWSKGEIRYGQGFVHYRNTYSTPAINNDSNNVINISSIGDGIQWLLYNIDTRTFRTYRYMDDTAINWNQRWVIIATFWINGQVQTLSCYKINGKPYGIDVSTSTGSFVANNARLLLPDKMFLVKGEDLPIYMSSIIPTSNEIANLNPVIRYKEGNNRHIDTFVDGYDLVGDKLQSGFRLGYTQNADAKLYFKDISVSYCDPATVSNKTPKILHIGDSITNRNVAARNEVFLKQWGITPTYVGTVDNQGSRRGEGREGWEYTNFVGMSSIWGNNNSIIVPDASSTTTNLNLNPFLKVATDDDKATYPDWCFTYNQVLRETSYTDAEDKDQTFYIFDIANYLSAHSVDTPDIITIALSTNDINRRADYLETCLFSMDVMISRIREQLPNVKIGIIPSPAWGHGNNTFTTKTAGWIEECMTAINARNDSNVFIVPIWCHMNRAWGFGTTATDLSDKNNSKSATLSDTIHPNTDGQEQYGKAMAMFLANMCL